LKGQEETSRRAGWARLFVLVWQRYRGCPSIRPDLSGKCRRPNETPQAIPIP